MLLAVTAGVISYSFYPGPATAPAAGFLGPGVFSAPGLPGMAGLLGQGQASSYAPGPAPIVTATATAKAPSARRKPRPTPSAHPTATPATSTSLTPLGGGNYAGSLVLNAAGSQLTAWNQTSSYCSQTPGFTGDGTVGTDSSGNAALSTTGAPGSCVGLISPGSYASDVIEANVYFPALPGQPGTIANWTAFWMTDGATWPTDGEIDATEAEPVTGVNAVSWHSGTESQQFVASTDGLADTKLPVDGPQLTPGWHTVDIAYTKGFFAVYYDGQLFTSYTSDNVTGSPLNIYFDMGVATSSMEQQIGGPPLNSDSSPATLAVKYVRVWSYH
jgi:hypothetical protein